MCGRTQWTCLKESVKYIKLELCTLSLRCLKVVYSGTPRVNCGGNPSWVKAIKKALVVELKMKTKLIKCQAALTIQKKAIEKILPENIFCLSKL